MDRKNALECAVSEIENICQFDYIKENPELKEDFLMVLNRLKDRKYRIAVVGEFSSGKSTLLNAVIGKDLLKHGALETTATITEIENVQDDNNVFDVYYEDGRIKENVPYDQIGAYTSAQSKEQVAACIKKVVIKAHMLDIDLPLVLVDTPGLNGTADSHRKKTIDQIQTAHACIYLMQLRGLAKSDIEFIHYLSEYQKNFIFVQNFIDELKEAEGESVESKLNEQEKILKKEAFQDQDDVHFEICGVSAREALLAAAKEIQTDQGRALTVQEREQLYKTSGIKILLDKIRGLAERNEQEALQQKDAVLACIQGLKLIESVLNEYSKAEEEEWKNSSENQILERYRRLKDRLSKGEDQKKNEEQISEFISASCARMRMRWNKAIKSNIEKIQTDMEAEVDQVKDLDQLKDNMTACVYQREVMERVQSFESKEVETIKIELENLYNNAILRVEKYIGTVKASQSIPEFAEMNHLEDDRIFQGGTEDQKELQEIEKKIAKKEAELQKADDKKRRFHRTIEGLNVDKAQSLENQRLYHAEYECRLDNLGDRPQAETKYRTVTKWRSHGGIGFLDWLFGEIPYKTQVPYRDDSKGRKWDQAKNEIENEYSRKKTVLDKALSRIALQLENAQKDLKDLEKKASNQKETLVQLQERLELKRQEIEGKEKSLRQEYLQILKKQVKKAIQAYLYEDENAEACLMENMEGMLNENSGIIIKHTLKLYRLSMQEKIRTLELKMQQLSGKTIVSNNEKALQDFERARKNLEEYLCQI